MSTNPNQTLIIPKTTDKVCFYVLRDVLNKRRLDTAFPSAMVFQKFGGKGDFVERLIAHCENRGGWEGMIDICRRWQPQCLL